MGYILGLIIFAFGVYGWVMNIVALIAMESITGFLVARVIGVFVAPLGAVLGYF